jgi:hypothetical protein
MPELRQQVMLCRSASDALASPNLVDVAKVHTRQWVCTEIIAIMAKGMLAIDEKRRMHPEVLALWVDEMVDHFGYESIADFRVFSRGLATGKWEDKEFYSSIDGPRMTKWFRRYLEEKSDARERTNDADKAPEDVIEGLKAVGLDAQLIKELAQKAGGMDNRSKSDDFLRRSVPHMTDDQLRALWPKYRDAWSRRIILNEATRRGLLGEEAKEAYLAAQKAEEEAYRKWEEQQPQTDGNENEG